MYHQTSFFHALNETSPDYVDAAAVTGDVPAYIQAKIIPQLLDLVAGDFESRLTKQRKTLGRRVERHRDVDLGRIQKQLFGQWGTLRPNVRRLDANHENECAGCPSFAHCGLVWFGEGRLGGIGDRGYLKSGGVLTPPERHIFYLPLVVR